MFKLVTNMFGAKRAPKAKLDLTDSVAIAILQTWLSFQAKEQVFLVGTKVWTDASRLEGSIGDFRQIRIQARPATLSEKPKRGLYEESTLPAVHATIGFVSGETSVYVWSF